MNHTRTLFGAMAGALLAGCAAQPPPPPPYVPAAVVNPPPKHIDVPSDPMATLPAAIRDAIQSGQLHRTPRNHHELPILASQPAGHQLPGPPRDRDCAEQ